MYTYPHINMKQVDETDEHGENPLHAAAADGVVRAVRLILDAGAHVDMPDASGNSALMIAVYLVVCVCVYVCVCALWQTRPTQSGQVPISFVTYCDV